MRDQAAALARIGVEIVGVSVDAVEKNRAFAEENGFPFRLLSDESRTIALAYGAAADRSAKAKRISYVIDEQGKIMRVYASVKPSEHAAEVLADLTACCDPSPPPRSSPDTP